MENDEYGIVLASDTSDEKPSRFGYIMKSLFYIITFQQSKMKQLEVEFHRVVIKDMDTVEVDHEVEKAKKRESKLVDSKKRITSLEALVKIAKSTIYEKQLEEILAVTCEVHNKFEFDLSLSPYKLEQFHTYHTDPLISLLKEGFVKITDIKIPMPVKIGEIVDTKLVEHNVEKIVEHEFITSDLFDIVDRSVFNKVQDILLSMNSSWKMTLPTFSTSSQLFKMAETYTKIDEVKRVLVGKPSDYVLIATVSTLYVVLLHKNGKSFIQVNLHTNFPRVLKLNT